MTTRPEAGLIVGWLSHPVGRLARQSSEPGAASTAPALAHTCERGASVSDRTCSVEGCAKPVNSRGWCAAHYRRWQRHGDPLGGRRTPTQHGAPRAFIEQAVRWQGEDCLPWPFARTNEGYGSIWYGNGSKTAHRLVLTLAKGQPPAEGMYAAHAPLICHNRLCVNPRHLRWATPAENTADMDLDGTERNKGESNATAKLTKDQVLALRADPRPHAAVAAELGVSAGHVQNIRGGRFWKTT